MPAGSFKALFNNFQRGKRGTACQLYQSPKSGDTVNSSTLITFSWDPSCLSDSPQYVDIVLLSAHGQVYKWQNADASPGSFDTELDAAWWGSAPSIQLQLGISATDTPAFLNPYSAGPVFTARNSNPPVAVGSSSSGTASVSRASAATAAVATTSAPVILGGTVNVAQLRAQAGLSHGRLALAIILPLFIAFAALAGYIFYVRRREAFKRAAWVETVDKRMSRLSGDWQSMSAIGNDAGRNSVHSSRARTPAMSAHKKSVSILGATRPSVSTEPRPSHLATSTDGPFAAEDLSQLGPRARALSEAAAAGRPISSALSGKDILPSLPPDAARARSQSSGAEGAFNAAGVGATVGSRPNYMRAATSSIHTRTLSTASNNPYATAMVQRDSKAISIEGSSVPFPHSASSPIPRPRFDSNGRPFDPNSSRARVGSRVSFADVSRPSGDRKRNMDNEKQALRTSARNHSGGDDYGFDFGDAYPALALMRVKSGEGLEGVAFPSADSPLTPTREFLPQPKRTDYFDGMPTSGLGGRTPDEMLKAYASALKAEKGGPQDAQAGTSNGGVVQSLKKFTGLWRR